MYSMKILFIAILCYHVSSMLANKATVPVPSCPVGHHWTPWYDRDNPSGKGDYEFLNDLRKENPGSICEKPESIQARLVRNQASWNTAGEKVKISPARGFTCVNADQPDRRCKDYGVRFCCPNEWGPWNAWSSCTATCGGGRRDKSRKCTSHEGSCNGKSTSYENCNTQQCPDTWSDWSAWTNCTETCNGGKRRRTRICIGSGRCVGKPKEVEPCNTQSCPDDGEEKDVCSFFKEFCHLPKVLEQCATSCGVVRDCEWHEFGPYGLCRNVTDDPENDGVFTFARKRMRTKKVAQNGGDDCVGKDFNFTACSEKKHASGIFFRTIFSALEGRSRTESKKCVQDVYDESKLDIVMSGRKCPTRRQRREVFDFADSTQSRHKRDIDPKSRDILFILDESGSVGPTNFVSLVDLAINVMSKFEELENDASILGIPIDYDIRAGVLTFDRTVYVPRQFTKFYDEIDETVFTYHTGSEGGTCLKDALRYSIDQMFTSNDKRGLVILFTDGCSNCGAGDLGLMAEELSIKGVPIITYLISPDQGTCFDNMKALADGSECYQLFRTENWATFEEDFLSESNLRLTNILAGPDECT